MAGPVGDHRAHHRASLRRIRKELIEAFARLRGMIASAKITFGTARTVVQESTRSGFHSSRSSRLTRSSRSSRFSCSIRLSPSSAVGHDPSSLQFKSPSLPTGMTNSRRWRRSTCAPSANTRVSSN